VSDPEIDADPAADDELTSPWIGLLTAVGAGLIAVVGVQVLLGLAQTLTFPGGEFDLPYRLGVPFGPLGPSTSLTLVVGLLLVSLPALLGEPVSLERDRMSGLVVTATIALAIILMFGAVLSTRATIIDYSQQRQGAVPAAVMIQFVKTLLGSLGAAALALFTGVVMRRLRRTEVPTPGV